MCTAGTNSGGGGDKRFLCERKGEDWYGGTSKRNFPTNICTENIVTLQSFLANQRRTKSFTRTKGKLGFSTF